MWYFLFERLDFVCVYILHFFSFDKTALDMHRNLGNVLVLLKHQSLHEQALMTDAVFF